MSETEVVGTEAVAAVEPDAEASADKDANKAAEKGKDTKDGRMRAFAGNEPSDYYEHAMRDFPLPSRMFMGFVLCLVGTFTKILWPWTVEGTEEIVSSDGKGRMIVMNHVSMLEPVALLVHLYVRGIRVRPIFKSEFNFNGIATWFFSRVGGIPVERGKADMRAVRYARAALQRGEYVLVYPEGTRIRTDDQPVEIHAGFALMAQLAKAPVVPMAVVGARQITTEGKFFKRIFWRVFLKAGRAIEWSELPAGKRKEQAIAMESLAMERVYKLRDELREEHPGKE